MKSWKKIKYYTYQEVLDLFPALRPNSPHSTSFADDWFSSILSSANLELAIYGVSQLITDDIIKDVVDALMTIVYQRHSNHFIYWKELGLDEDYELDVADFEKYIRTLLNIIELSVPKYIPLLQDQEYYSYAPTSPLQSKTTGRTRFNDTPQDSGEFADDSHTTHITTSKNDYDTLMGRIEEIDRKYRNVMRDWAREFEPLFIHEESL